MDIYNVPDDKRDREIHLNARRHALTELLDSLAENGVLSPAVSGQIHNDIEDINKMLEE